MTLVRDLPYYYYGSVDSGGFGLMIPVPVVCIGFIAGALLAGAPVAADSLAQQRESLLIEIAQDFEAMGDSTGVEHLDPAVAGAMRRTPREDFVPEAQRPYAYANRPLPIGYGQTISQPLIVALMTQLLDIEAGDRVFELGTGSGYQAAVLGRMGAEVYSVEIVPELGERAAGALQRLGYAKVHTRVGDGYHGWPEAAPFDAIIVTAAGSHIPPPLVRQLAPGGRMVIPVGGRFAVQQLVLVTKDADGGVQTRSVLPVRFVPLTGGH